MSNADCDEFDLSVLNPDANLAYLPKPIPTPRDAEIGKLLSTIISERRIARFGRCLDDGHRTVLRAFSERMASAAIRERDPNTLGLGLIALLLAWHGGDSREALTIFPLYYDASQVLGLDVESFVTSVRLVIGAQAVQPFIEFLGRSDTNKTLQVMGYRVGTDEGGFRYIRDW